MTTRVISFVLAGAFAACGGDDAATPDAAIFLDAMPREVVDEDVVLVVDEVVEAVMVGGAGDYARIQAMVPSEALDWNIHGHADGGTQVVNEGFKQMSVDYVFAPTAEADWYLLLRNKGQTDITVELKIELYGGMTWSGWQ